MDLTKIISQLPNILTYVVEGYIFLSVYDFIAFKKEKFETKYVFLKSVVISFVLKTIFDIFYGFFVTQINTDTLYIALLFVFSALIAFVLARISTAKWFSDILCNIGIYRTTNENIWDDVIDNNKECWICMRSNKKDDLQYLGLHTYTEEFKREPIIALKYYQLLNMDGEVIADFSDTEDVLLLNTKDFEKIEIAYKDKKQNITKAQRNR